MSGELQWLNLDPRLPRGIWVRPRAEGLTLDPN